MDLALKQRLVGAIVLIALAVIFLPMILDGAGTSGERNVGVEIPERTEAPESGFDEPDVESELAAGESAATDGAGDAPEGGDGDQAAEAGTSGEPAASGWVVQVGSFSQDANAIVLRDRLRDDGFAAFVSEGRAEGNPVWRVRIGPVPDEAEARELARQLESERDRPALVMSYP